jgi:hypothetical protein
LTSVYYRLEYLFCRRCFYFTDRIVKMELFIIYIVVCGADLNFHQLSTGL